MVTAIIAVITVAIVANNVMPAVLHKHFTKQNVLQQGLEVIITNPVKSNKVEKTSAAIMPFKIKGINPKANNTATPIPNTMLITMLTHLHMDELHIENPPHSMKFQVVLH